MKKGGEGGVWGGVFWPQDMCSREYSLKVGWVRVKDAHIFMRVMNWLVLNDQEGEIVSSHSDKPVWRGGRVVSWACDLCSDTGCHA